MSRQNKNLVLSLALRHGKILIYPLTQKPMKTEHTLLHQKFQEYGKNAKEWMRKCVLLLPEIEKNRIWEQKNFGSIYEYAAKLAGMGRHTVDDALRILRRIQDKPELQKVVALKGLNAVRPVAAIATPETEKFWAVKAKQMSKHTLESYVQEYVHEQNFRTGTENSPENHQQQAIDKKLLVMELEPEIADQLEKLKGQETWNELMKQFLKIRKEKVEEQKPAAVETESRHIPNAIQRFVEVRDNGQCAYPRCKKPITIDHHVDRFALKNVHDPSRIYGLCKEHERLMHLGIIENEHLPPENWKIRTAPDPTLPKFEIDQIVAKFRTPKNT